MTIDQPKKPKPKKAAPQAVALRGGFYGGDTLPGVSGAGRIISPAEVEQRADERAMVRVESAANDDAHPLTRRLVSVANSLAARRRRGNTSDQVAVLWQQTSGKQHEKVGAIAKALKVTADTVRDHARNHGLMKARKK